MSEEERKLLDAAGDYRYAVRDGERLSGGGWQSCRVVLTDKRLVVAGDGSNRSIPHGKVTIPDDPGKFVDDPADAVPLRIGSNVIVVSTTGSEDVTLAYCRANLGGAVLLVRHPAVIGGVVQDDAEWTKARFLVDEESFSLQYPDGREVSCALDDVGTVDSESRTVMEAQRRVVEIEHTDAEGRSEFRGRRALELAFVAVVAVVVFGIAALGLRRELLALQGVGALVFAGYGFHFGRRQTAAAMVQGTMLDSLLRHLLPVLAFATLVPAVDLATVAGLDRVVVIHLQVVFVIMTATALMTATIKLRQNLATL